VQLRRGWPEPEPDPEPVPEPEPEPVPAPNTHAPFEQATPCLVLHSLPQLPQLSLSLCRLAHTEVPHGVPDAHTSLHAPLTQLCPGAQLRAQLPQFAASSDRFAQ
jgi:hypothetical protein